MESSYDVHSLTKANQPSNSALLPFLKQRLHATQFIESKNSIGNGEKAEASLFSCSTLAE